MKKINVLIFPAGEVISVELHDALATSVNVNLFGASSVDRHGPYVFKNYTSGLPLLSDKNFILKFNELLTEKSIDLVFPTHDDVVTFFADNMKKIKSKVLVPDKNTARICRDKALIYETFKNCDFLPKILPTISEYPVFIKPRSSQGGVGAKLVEDQKDIPTNVDFVSYVINEFLPGEEYSVDCLTDKEGKLIFVSPRSRDRIMAGICVAGETKPLTKEIQHIAEEINKRLVFRGLWFFQIKKASSGRWKLLEVAARCASTMGLTRARGVNLPLLSVYIALGHDVSVIPNPYKAKMDRTLITRYQIDYEYDKVYLDFDDTLVINGRVHPYTIMYLYQCKNQGKKVYLLTKHANDIHETLARYAIDEQLFERIISIAETEEKIASIGSGKSIFIDNAYSERKLVFDKFGIPVFDVDMLEVLLDWRT